MSTFECNTIIPAYETTGGECWVMDLWRV